MDQALDFSMKKHIRARFGSVRIDADSPMFASDGACTPTRPSHNLSPQPSSTSSPHSSQPHSPQAPRLPHSVFGLDAYSLSPTALTAGFSPLVSSTLFPTSPTLLGDAAFFPTQTAIALSGLQRRRRAPSQSSNPDLAAKKPTPVPDEKKDDLYWERRRKNNEAAKRSRDSRRLKEEEVALRAALLEQENLKLKAQVAILKNETAKLHYMIFSHVRPGAELGLK